MPDTTRRRPSHDVVLPDDVTDPLLWRLAYDVAIVHRPDDSGRCGSPDCADPPGHCTAWRNAERAMRLARSDAPGERRAGGFAQMSPISGADPATNVFLPPRRPGAALRAA